MTHMELDTNPEDLPVPTPAPTLGVDVALTRAPNVVLDEAHQAARALGRVLDSKAKKIMFNGKRHLECEDWILLGRFYGITGRVVPGMLEEVDDDGDLAFRAWAEAVRADGAVISRASALCSRREENWAAKPRFQLESMAQTRCVAKCLANVLRWVPVLAGYAGTPAEEMVGTTAAAPAARDTTARPSRSTSTAVISEPQRKRMYAIWKSAGHEDDAVKAWLAAAYGIEHGTDIPRHLYDAICTRLGDAAPLEAADTTPATGDDAIKFGE